MNPNSFYTGTGEANTMHNLRVSSVLCLLLVASRLTAQSLTPSLRKANLDLPVSVLSANEDEDEDAPEVVVFYGQVFESDAFVYVVDASLSVEQRGGFTVVKREVIKNIQEFSPKVEFGIVFYSLELDTFPMVKRPPLVATSETKRRAIAWVRGMLPRTTHTCIKKALVAGLDMATRSTKRRRLIIYLGTADGHCSGHPLQDRYLKETLAEVTTKNSGRVKIHAIGVGIELFQANFLRDLTSANGGTFTLKTRNTNY